MAPSDRAPQPGRSAFSPQHIPSTGYVTRHSHLGQSAVFITYPVDGICYPDLTISSSVNTLGLKVMNLEEHLLLAHASRGHGLLPSLGHQDGASTPGSRSTASGSSAATRTSPTRPGTATTTHASTTGSKLTYTLAGDSSPVTPPRRERERSGPPTPPLQALTLAPLAPLQNPPSKLTLAKPSSYILFLLEKKNRAQ